MAINLYLAKKYGRGRMGVETLEGEALASQWSFWAITRLEVPFLTVAASIPVRWRNPGFWFDHGMEAPFQPACWPIDGETRYGPR
jgi:glutathione S-transferase